MLRLAYLLFVFILFPSMSHAETIDVQIKGIDDGVRTTKQQDYKEAVLFAKREAIERAGVRVKALTTVKDFIVHSDYIESEAEALLLPGYSIMDMGYSADGTYQVVLTGKIKPVLSIKDKKFKYDSWDDYEWGMSASEASYIYDYGVKIKGLKGHKSNNLVKSYDPYLNPKMIKFNKERDHFVLAHATTKPSSFGALTKLNKLYFDKNKLYKVSMDFYWDILPEFKHQYSQPHLSKELVKIIDANFTFAKKIIFVELKEPHYKDEENQSYYWDLGSSTVDLDNLDGEAFSIIYKQKGRY